MPGALRRHAGALHRLGGGARAAARLRHRRRLGHRRVRDAAALHPRAHGAGGRARQAGRPHPGDPAAHRPGAARGGGPARAGPPHRHPRLRRAPGRRRHPHRRHHRRLGGPGAGAAQPWQARRRSPARPRGATWRPSRWASSTARSTSTSTTARTPPPRSTSTWWPPARASWWRCRARRRASPSGATSSTGWSTSPWSASAACARPRRRRRGAGGGAVSRLLFGTGNRAKLRELRRMVTGLGLEVVSPGRARAGAPGGGGGRRHLRGERPQEGARLRPRQRPARGGRRLGPVRGRPGGRARGALRPLGLRRRSRARAGQPRLRAGRRGGAGAGPEAARLERDARNNELLREALAAVPDEARGAAYVAVLVLAGPGGEVLAEVRGELPGAHRPGSAGQRRLRLRPLVRAGGGAARAATATGEPAPWPSSRRPRRTPSRTGARPCARCGRR